MRKILRALLTALMLAGLLGAASAASAQAAPVAAVQSGSIVAYPGTDGYDSGYCWADGIKMGLSNYKSGQGQIIAVDVDDHSGYANLSYVWVSTPVGSFTATTSLARKEIYRANPAEVQSVTLYTNRGSTCTLKLDGRMMP